MPRRLEQDVKVVNKAGLHARPASGLIMAVIASGCDVRIENTANGIEADAQRLMDLLMLSAGQGSTLRIKVDGENPEEIMETLVKMFESGFNEDQAIGDRRDG